MAYKNKTSVYKSIVAEYEALIRVGALKNGEKLPSVRALALERGINPNTVERAYVELEEAGLIRVYPKKGAYVECSGAGKTRIEAEAKRAVEELKKLGVTKEQLERVVQEVFEEDV